MKFFLFALISFAVTAAPNACNKKAQQACYQGRLEIKGMCKNYTLSVVGTQPDGVLPAWTDEQTGKSYNNVFALANPCGFPDSLNEGDTFYFTVVPQQNEDCMVCQAYYPTPGKKLSIQVVAGPCTVPVK